MPLYATFQSDRIGKQLTVRDGGPQPLAVVTYPRTARVTYRMISEALKDQGYVLDGRWRQVRSILRADLLPLRDKETL